MRYRHFRNADPPALVVVDPGTETVGVVRVNDPAAVAAERARLDAEGATRPTRRESGRWRAM